MENRLEEVSEHLEHVEHLASHKFRTVITVLVLLVTAVATLAGVLVSRWSGDESAAQRSRHELAAAAVSDDLHANALGAADSEQSDEQKEAGWEAAFLRLHETGADPTSQLLERQAVVADEQHRQRGAAPSTAQLDAASVAQTVDAGMSEVKAQVAADNAAKESAALTVISMLAVALFLLGLAPTIPIASSRWVFIGLAVIGLLVSVARLSYLAAGSAEVPTRACVQHYATARLSTTYESEITRLRPVVGACPGYADAYQALANARSALGTTAGMRASEADYRTAIRLRPAYSAILYNNLANAQIFDGHTAAARATLERAMALDPHNEVTLATFGEQRALSGDGAAANRDLDQALALVAQHGPYFRAQYFSSLRSDEQLAQILGIESHTLAAFFARVRDAEASFDVYGRPQPGDAHGASITGVTAHKASGKIGQAGCATLGYTFHGLRPGDHLSVRWYLDNTIFSLAQSVLDQTTSTGGDGTLRPDAYVVPTPAGIWTVEIYVNGNLRGSTTFTMPQGTEN